VESVRVRPAEPERVYNLTVSGLHTYYAGEPPVLVHNADCPDEGASAPGKLKNGHLAGKTHPKTGVRFKPTGYPDFTPHAKITVKVDGMTGYDSDFALANRAAGIYRRSPAGTRGITWRTVRPCSSCPPRFTPRPATAVELSCGEAWRRASGEGEARVPLTFEEAAPPASPEQVSATERALGMTLPAGYRDFLELHNGGYLEGGSFGGEITVERLFSAGETPVEELEDLVSARTTYSGPDSDHDLPDFLLPVGADLFGNLVCVSVAEGEAGTVYFWDHEIADPEDAYRSLGVSFEGFIDRLNGEGGE
jgi:cell wall assembly regulator SMI1